MNEKIYDLFINNKNILEEINDILSEIIEWYVCSLIVLYKNKSIIIHLGLAHSEKVIYWLVNNYLFKINYQQGINRIYEIDYKNMEGCINLSSDLDKKF